jgi:hypothetical protein
MVHTGIPRLRKIKDVKMQMTTNAGREACPSRTPMSEHESFWISRLAIRPTDQVAVLARMERESPFTRVFKALCDIREQW